MTSAPADTLPTAFSLTRSRPIGLSRHAGTPKALALVSAVASLVQPYLPRTRRVGPTGMITLRAHVAAILAGVLRPGFRGLGSTAQRGKAGEAWRGEVPGHMAFWRTVDAMRAAGLLGYRAGIKIALEWEGAFSFGGRPSNLWPRDHLLALATQHGVTADTVRDDWPIRRDAGERWRAVPENALVVCLSKEPRADRGRRVRYSPAQADEAAAMTRRVATLNAHIATADIEGCLAPVLVRNFRHCLRLGGRLYARGGADNYQNILKAERRDVRINGEATKEVDIHASFLTIFLALTGTTQLPPGDLYDLGDLDRGEVKEWFVKTFGNGRPATRWKMNPGDVPKRHKATEIKRAALKAYPALEEPTAIVPKDILGGLPQDLHKWAVGQYLTYRESVVIEGALGYLRGRGVIALPMHDAIIVPQGAVKWALQGLEGAFLAHVGIAPRIR